MNDLESRSEVMVRVSSNDKRELEYSVATKATRQYIFERYHLLQFN